MILIYLLLLSVILDGNYSYAILSSISSAASAASTSSTSYTQQQQQEQQQDSSSHYRSQQYSLNQQQEEYNENINNIVHRQIQEQQQNNDECSITGFGVYNSLLNSVDPIVGISVSSSNNEQQQQQQKAIANTILVGRVIVSQYSDSKINIVTQINNNNNINNNNSNSTTKCSVKCVKMTIGMNYTINDTTAPYTFFKKVILLSNVTSANTSTTEHSRRLPRSLLGYQLLTSTLYNTNNCTGTVQDTKSMLVHFTTNTTRSIRRIKPFIVTYNGIIGNTSNSNSNNNTVGTINISKANINTIVAKTCQYIKQALYDTYSIHSAIQFERSLFKCWRVVASNSTTNTTTSSSTSSNKNHTIKYKIIPTYTIQSSIQNKYYYNIDYPTIDIHEEYITKLFYDQITLFSNPYVYMSTYIKQSIPIWNPFSKYTSISLS